MTSQRLRTVFHESFALSRPAVSQVLAVAGEIEQRSLPESLAARLSTRTNLGTNYVKAMPKYAIAAGLLNPDYSPTAFGRAALRNDPSLEQLSTQWLMHYKLCAPDGSGPSFWNEFVRSRFAVGTEFSAEELAEQLSEHVVQTEGKGLAQRSLRSTVTVFLGTYTKMDALGSLCILKRDEGQTFQVQSVRAAPTWVCAFALLEHWRGRFRERVSINEDALTERGGFCDLLMIGGGQLNAVLRGMEEVGYVERYRVSPPYQVVLLRQDPGPLLERMYGLI